MPVVYGAKYGVIQKPVYGPGSAFPTVAGGVAQDGPSSWFVPASNADMATLGIPNAAAIRGMQDVASPAVDAVAGNNLTATGTVAFQQTVPGWARKAITISTGAANRLGRAVAELPVPASSFLWMGYVIITSSAAARSILVGTASAAATELTLRKNATDLLSIKVGAAAANGAASIASTSQWVALLYDATNSRVCAYSLSEKLPGTYSVVVDGNKGWGAGVTIGADISVVWDAVWTGASAELTDAQVKTRAQALGITIPWT